MGEEILDFGPVKDTMQGIIKVIGVGGGGDRKSTRLNSSHRLESVKKK